jgi:phage-related protein
MDDKIIKPVAWVGSSYKDYRAFPDAVQDGMGYALYRAQTGGLHGSAKPLRGFGGAGVIEIVEDYDTNTYRAVYTVRYAKIIYVLHAFQKKAKRGSKTPDSEMEIIRRRLKVAADDYRKLTKEKAHG